MLVLEVIITGAFTDHLHYERRDNIWLDVLDLQNLFAVLLSHRSHLGETGHHFGVQQAGGAEETKEVQSVKYFRVSGVRVAPRISLTVFLVLSSYSQSRFLGSVPSFHEACQSHCVAAHLDGLIDTNKSTNPKLGWVQMHTVSRV